MNIELVESASVWWKKYSTWVFGAIATLAALQPFLGLFEVILPGAWFNLLVAVVAAAGVFLTQVKQPSLAEKKPLILTEED